MKVLGEKFRSLRQKGSQGQNSSSTRVIAPLFSGPPLSFPLPLGREGFPCDMDGHLTSNYSGIQVKTALTGMRTERWAGPKQLPRGNRTITIIPRFLMPRIQLAPTPPHLPMHLVGQNSGRNWVLKPRNLYPETKEPGNLNKSIEIQISHAADQLMAPDPPAHGVGSK